MAKNKSGVAENDSPKPAEETNEVPVQPVSEPAEETPESNDLINSDGVVVESATETPASPLNKTINDVELKEGETNLAGKVKSVEEKNEQINSMTEAEKDAIPEESAPLDETLLDSRGAISPQAMEELKVKKKDIEKAVGDGEEENTSIEGARLHIKAALRMVQDLALSNDELPEVAGKLRSALILFEGQYPA